MMLSPFFCGTGTFQHEEEDEQPLSPSATPKRSRKSSLNRSKNPYSTRGLEKFSALLSDLEEKRQKIYSQMGSQDISIVRFVYSNSNDCTPIVVKARDKKLNNNNNDIKDKPILPHHSQALDESSKEVKQSSLEAQKITEKNAKKKRVVSWNFKLDKLRRPSYYVPVVVILILLFLTVFGRSVAILCTTIGWYLVPTINSRSLNSKRLMKKKELTRRLSENKMVSDGLLASQKKVYTRRLSENKMVNDNAAAGGAPKDKIPGVHGHRKSF